MKLSPTTNCGCCSTSPGGPCKTPVVLGGCDTTGAAFGTGGTMHGARIDVYSDPGRTNLVDSQTTDMGSAIISTPSSGHYYVRITRDRFITLEDEADFNCVGAQPVSFILAPDPAYVCCTGCTVPIKKTP